MAVTETGRSPAASRSPSASARVVSDSESRPARRAVERRAARGDRERVPAQRAGLVDVAGGRDPLHQRQRPAERRRRQPAAQDLAHHGQVRQHAGQLLRAARRDAEAGDHLVEDQQRVVAGAEVAQQLEEAGRGRDQAHVGRIGLDQHRGELVLGERGAHRLGIVPGHDDGLRGGGGRHAGRRRDALRREPGPGLGQQPVDVPVVGAGELQQHVAAGGGAREPDRAHRRLGPRRGHPQHVDRRHPGAHELGQLDLAGGRRAVASSRAPRPRSPRRARPDARGRGSAGPTSTRSRRRRCRRRRSAPPPDARSMKIGSRPIARIARTGEFTPPGQDVQRAPVELRGARVREGRGAQATAAPRAPGADAGRFDQGHEFSASQRLKSSVK